MKKHILVFTLIVCAACAPALPDALVFKGDVKQQVKVDGVKRVAVLELKNTTANKEASEKIMGLFTAELMRTRRFNLVERSQIDRVMQEIKLGMSGILDEQSAKEAGKILGADAVIVGEITSFQHDVKSVEYKYSRDKGNVIPLPPGDKTPTIMNIPGETRTYTIDKYHVSVGFSLRMISVSSGEIIWSKHVARSFGMREGEYEIRNVFTLFDKIVDAAVKESVYDFIP